MADELGYQSYAAQGGDWGAGVTARLGFHHANHVLGIHTTSVTQAIPYQGASLEGLSRRERLEQVIGTPQGGYRRDFASTLSDDELAMIDQRVSWAAAEGGYGAYPGHQAPDPGLWSERFSRWPLRLDRREVPHLERLQRGRGERLHQGRPADHRDDLLGDPNHQLQHTALLREQPHALVLRARRPDWRPLRHRRVPQGAVHAAALLGGANLQCAALDRDGQRRPFAALEKPAELANDMREFFRGAAVASHLLIRYFDARHCMGTTEWTIIGTGIALLVVLVPMIRFTDSASTNEVKAIIASLRAELKGEIADLRTEIANLRTELKLDIQANRNEITANRRLLARFALHRHGDDGLPLAPLTDTLDPSEGTGGSNGEGNG